MNVQMWFLANLHAKDGWGQPHFIYKDKLPMTEKNVNELMKKTFVNNREDTNFYNIQQVARIRIIKDKDWGD